MLRLVTAAFAVGLLLSASAVSARCGIAANESTIYGYTSLSGSRCTTLEELEAELRGSQMPLAANAFTIPGAFDRQAVVANLDYRPYGALGSGASVLTGPPVATTSTWRVYVKNWPPVSPLAACTIAGCGSEGCVSPELERQRLQCQLDVTWAADARYCWARTAPVSLSGSVTRFARVNGIGAESGALLYAPASSTSNDSGASFSVALQSCATRQDGGMAGTRATQTVNWGIARQDNVSCGAGAGVNGAANSPETACQAGFNKTLLVAPRFTQTPTPCSEGNPCFVGNGNKAAHEAVFRHGRIAFDLHYTSLRQLRNYGSLDTNWSHSFARRLLTEWSHPGHLGTNPETSPIAEVTTVFVQDEQPTLEVYRRDGSLPAGVFRATTRVGRTLRYTEDGTTPPYYELTYEDGRRERYDRAGRLTGVLHRDDPSLDLTITWRGRTIVAEPNVETAHLEEAFWRIDRVTDASGRYASFDYADVRLQRLDRITADDGTELARFVYDPDGRLVNLLRFGKSRTFLYNEPGHLGVSASVRGSWLTGILDEDGRRYASYTYDEWGRATASWHGIDAGRVDITYPLNPDGTQDDSRAIVRTPSLRETTYTFAANHPYRAPASVTDQAGTVQFEYHPSTFLLTAHTDRRGTRTEIAYDADGSRERVRTEAKGLPEQRRRERDWDYALGRLTAERLYADPPAGPRTLLSDRRFHYAPGTGQLIRTERVDPVDGRVRATEFTYCSAADVATPATGCARVGQLKRIDGPRSDVADVTDYVWYTADSLGGCGSVAGPCARKGDLRTVTNALGQTTEIVAYDRAGRPVRVRDPNGTLTDYTYHPRGWLRTRTVRANADGSASAADAVTTLDYDESGNVTKLISPDNGAALTYVYDDAHRLISVRDALGNRIVYTLTSHGDRRAERRFSAASANVWQVMREYDELNRLVREIDALNRPVLRLERDDPAAGILNGYDANGNPRHSVDGRDVATEQRYDGLNRLVKTLQDVTGTGTSANAQTQFAYDAADRLTGVTDPDGVATGYVYDGLGDLRQETSRDAGNRSFVYDLAGNRIGETDARGISTTHVYDALNRRTDTFYPDLSRRVRRDYDLPDTTTGCPASYPKGRLSRITDASGVTTYCYDRRGNVVRKRWAAAGGATQQVDYRYDKVDQLSSVTYPGGAVVSYLRGGDGRISGVQWQPTAGSAVTPLVSQVSHAAFGPLTSLTFGNGRQLAKRYDRNFAIDQIESTLPGGLVLDIDTDVLGNVTQIATALGAAPQRRYDYDPLNRLTHLRDGAGAALETFTYSPTGDRTSKQLGATAPQTYTYQPNTHRLAATGSAARSYDANGNTTGIAGISPYPLVYDDTNRLTQVAVDGVGSRADYGYTYNGLGQRTGKSAPDAAIDTVYDEAGLRLVDIHWTLDCGSSESLRAGTGPAATCTRIPNGRTEYIYLDGLPVAVARYAAGSTAAQLSYLETDHLGTPRVAVDAATQAIQWKWDLLATAFGDHPATVPPGGFALNLRYPGQYYDAETGLHYNRYRDYQPLTGRYVQADLIGLDGGINLYSYVDGRPLNGTDRLGLACDDRGCWNTPEEAAAIAANDPYSYYSLACKGGDPYACRAYEVATNTGEGLRGLLSSVTNWKLSLGMAKRIPTGCPDYAMKEIIIQNMQKVRVDLAKRRFAQLAGFGPDNPVIVTRESISRFHQEVFELNGASAHDFGGDLWDMGRYFGTLVIYDWCESPACR